MGNYRSYNDLKGMAVILLAFIAMFILMCLTSCRSQKVVTIETQKTKIDTFYENNFIVDTLYKVSQKHDSIYVKDSIYVHAKNDTVWVEKSNTKYIERLKLDTIWKDRVVTQIQYESKVDSIPVVTTVEVEKKVTKWDRFKTWLTDLGLSIILAILIFLGYKVMNLVRKVRGGV